MGEVELDGVIVTAVCAVAKNAEEAAAAAEDADASAEESDACSDARDDDCPAFDA